MTNFLTVLGQEKKEFSAYLLNFLKQEEQLYQKLSLGKDVFKRLKKFVTTGKMARASLLSLTYQSLSPNIDQKMAKEIILPLGSALELIHSGLLIHDDIIDRDEQRRGQASIWYQYAKTNGQAKLAHHYGVSQAICVADLCFYLANQLILRATANLTAQPGLHIKKAMAINETINREISQVILAEMLDSQLAMIEQTVTLEQISELNLYKTARYTFSLPMVLAGHLLGAEVKTIKTLESIGEQIGLIFQIQDDYLGLFGDSKKTGKPILSDLREGKKTIFYYHLVNNPELSQAERQLFEQHFAHNQLTATDEKKLQALFQSKSWPAVEQELKNCQTEAEKLIDSLPEPALRAMLKQALQFAKTRIN